MSEDSSPSPLRDLGSQLRNIRQQHRESMADAAGAVEIDESLLERIEQGNERPTEDVLMLLISHFDMPDDQADRLWELAGYEPPETDGDDHQHDRHLHEDASSNRAAMLVLAVDPRVSYTDGVHIRANSKGVVLSFGQATGTPQALVTARVGMSREQAYVVLDTLQKALKDSEPRQLPGKFDDSQNTGGSKKSAA